MLQLGGFHYNLALHLSYTHINFDDEIIIWHERHIRGGKCVQNKTAVRCSKLYKGDSSLSMVTFGISSCLYVHSSNMLCISHFRELLFHAWVPVKLSVRYNTPNIHCRGWYSVDTEGDAVVEYRNVHAIQYQFTFFCVDFLIELHSGQRIVKLQIAYHFVALYI